MSWTRLEFGGTEARLGRFNFHREEDYQRAEAFLRGDGAAGDGPSVLVLSADVRGAGRSYFLDALAFRLRYEALPPLIWHLDLSGFEPDHPQAILAYLGYQIEKRQARLAGQKEELLKIAKPLSQWLLPTELGATLVALFLELRDPVQAFEKLLAAEADGLWGPARRPEEALERALVDLTQDRRVVLHVVDFAHLKETMRLRLVELAEKMPRVFVAFSCYGEPNKGVAPLARHEVLRIEIDPLSQRELRQLIDRRLDPNDLPDALVEAVWRSTGGIPARVGARMAELVAEAAIVDEGQGWRLTEQGMTAEEVAARFRSEINDRLDGWLLGQGDNGQPLRNLLVLGALCGDVFPPKLFLGLMDGIEDEEHADTLIDEIDDYLVEELGWIEDLEFRHPGFPGMQVYRFAHPALAGVLLHKVGAEGASRTAKDLREALEKKFPPWTLGAGLLHLALCRHLAPAYQKPVLEQLSWWAGMEESALLERRVREKIESGEIDSEVVWQLVFQTTEKWPPYRRLALLDAYAGAQIKTPSDGRSRYVRVSNLPMERTPIYVFERGHLLFDLGRYEEAVEAGATAVELLADRAGELESYLAACHLHGMALMEAGHWDDAREVLAATYEKSLGGAAEATQLFLARLLASALHKLGELPRARELEEQVLEHSPLVFGTQSVETARAMVALAATLRRQGELGRAQELAEKGLELLRLLRGPSHRLTLNAMAILAGIFYKQENFPAARRLEEETLELRRQQLGPEHPDTLEAMSMLAGTLYRQGEVEAARLLAAMAYEGLLKVFGGEHPDTRWAKALLDELMAAEPEAGGSSDSE